MVDGPLRHPRRYWPTCGSATGEDAYGLRGLCVGFGGNYASDNKIQNSISQGEFILPAYTVLNASTFYDQRKFRISAKVDNLTNQHYWIGYTTMNAQKLRSFVGSIAYKF